MFYKNIIFDIDNTLYNYNTCHSKAIYKVFCFISNIKKCDVSLIEKSYKDIDEAHKTLTINTASSHNKYIKIKQLLKEYDMNYFEETHTLYWDTFYENIKPFENILVIL